MQHLCFQLSLLLTFVYSFMFPFYFITLYYCYYIVSENGRVIHLRTTVVVTIYHYYHGTMVVWSMEQVRTTIL